MRTLHRVLFVTLVLTLITVGGCSPFSPSPWSIEYQGPLDGGVEKDTADSVDTGPDSNDITQRDTASDIPDSDEDRVTPDIVSDGGEEVRHDARDTDNDSGDGDSILDTRSPTLDVPPDGGGDAFRGDTGYADAGQPQPCRCSFLEFAFQGVCDKKSLQPAPPPHKGCLGRVEFPVEWYKLFLQTLSKSKKKQRMPKKGKRYTYPDPKAQTGKGFTFPNPSGTTVPVNGVSWYDARAAAKKAVAQAKVSDWGLVPEKVRKKLPDPYVGGSLPTCRRVVMSDSSMGGDGCGRGKPWPSCRKQGGGKLCDSSGNIAEWGSKADYPGPKAKVLGGSWNQNGRLGYLKPWKGWKVSKTTRNPKIGFRIWLVPKPP